MSRAAGSKLGTRVVNTPAGAVRWRDEDGKIAMTLEGSLDEATGAALLDSVAKAVAGSPERVDIDVRQITAFEAPGAEALARCRDMCAQVPAGLHYRTEGGAGQLALLAAFEREPLVEFE
jgi:hypothetical protein